MQSARQVPHRKVRHFRFGPWRPKASFRTDQDPNRKRPVRPHLPLLIAPGQVREVGAQRRNLVLSALFVQFCRTVVAPDFHSCRFWRSFKVILRGRGGTFFALIDVNCLISIFYYETHTSMSSVFHESVRICTAYCGRQSGRYSHYRH